MLTRLSITRVVTAGLLCATAAPLAAQQQRPMDFLDVQLMRSAGSLAVSPNGQWVLYTLSVPDWKEARSTTDIWLVSATGGVSSARQLTYTKDKSEANPVWSADGSFFVFASNRDAPSSAAAQNQVYVMRPDGGESRKVTDAKDGVAQFEFTRDGKWLVYAAGKAEDRQLWMLPVSGIDSAPPVQLTKHATPLGTWELSNDGRTVFFLAPDSVDKDDRERREKKFTATLRNQPMPPNSFWSIDIATKQEKRLTNDATFSAASFSLSNDGKWAGVRAIKNDRYARNITEESISGDLWLVNLATPRVERLTNNAEIGEGNLSFAPDGKTIAFSAANDFKYFRDNRLYIRAIDATGAAFREIGDGYDGDVNIGWWSNDSRTIYFADGVRATTQVMSIDVATGKVTQVTNEKATISVSRDDRSGRLLITYADPKTPTSHYTVSSLADVSDRTKWTRLTNANPQVAGFALGEAEEITWKSKDGKMVGGVLVKPVGYRAGQKYPLIVAIHGGPAGADVLGFNGGYGSQIYAGDGYAVLLPNYRGSTNYGEQHRLDIVGDYFKKGYEDIMTGVDYLIAQGIVDGTKMGALGWSAGGHWSNWILVSTDRFKSISTGAGTTNWISMFAQSDVQRNRQEYLGGKLPYEDFEPYWKQSPIRYIKNAKTPTMIHVVDGDPRVPRPQSEELHMALKKLGVPTEFFVYPGNTHGIPDPRNRLLKSVAEKAWMDKWILGKGDFRWRDVLKTLEDRANVSSTSSP
ncbi:MAG TPA: S9 family peptidase [Gemmatimonadaceae bacterium]|nr:S9 family peptidase [Gemmatimonadaceae bacterium]